MIKRNQVIKAIKALQEFKAAQSQKPGNKKAKLIEDEEYIYVTASMYKIYKPANTVPIPL